MKYIKHILALSFTLALLFGQGQLFAQFYNGQKMTFGKNRVQYNDFYWQYYRFPKFDTYFYVGGNQLAEYVSREVEGQLELLEYELEEILQHRLIFVVYNKLSEFKQSNIGLVSGSTEYNTGGVMRIIDNKVFLYYEGDHNKLKKQIRAALAEILINEMLYGGSFRSRLKSSTLLSLPEWFVSGLVSYLAYDLDAETESHIKHTLIDKKTRKLQQLQGDKAKYAGHSFWRHISEMYGKQVIPNILYITRITQSLDNGFMYVLGMSFKDVVNDAYYYTQSRYNDEIQANSLPASNYYKIKKRPRKKFTYNQVEISPDGKYIAYSGNIKGKYKIWIYNTQTRKTKKLFRKEQKIEQITDYSYPILTWHPSSKVISFAYERKGHIWLELHNIENKEKQKRELFYIDKVLDYSFSSDAQNLVMSAVKDGHTDIFTYSIGASSYKRITDDIADDLYPKFIGKTNNIIFSSNRTNKLLHQTESDLPSLVGNNLNLFVYHANNDTILTQITNTQHINEIRPYQAGNNEFIFLSDNNGLNNQYFLKIDSTINFIDTAIHYRPTYNNHPITNNAFYITNHSYNVNNNQSSIFFNGKKRFSLLGTSNTNLDKTDNTNTWFRDYYNRQIIADSLLKVDIENSKKPDTSLFYFTKKINNDTLIDINHYVFEKERNKSPQQLLLDSEEQYSDEPLQMPKQLVYFTNFYNNLMVAQVDFGFMNQSYQPYTGGPFYHNPGMNLFTKLGAIDLFEDYKITAGIRWAFNLKIDEFLFSVEDLKHRLDKQYIYYRQVYDAPNNEYYTKVYSNTLMTIFNYPITQTYGFKGTASVRYDRHIYKALDFKSLNKKDKLQFWTGLKGEFIYDDTRKLAENTYNGTRLKVFGEYYQCVNKDNITNMFVVGFDVRNYLPIHRHFILATRVAGSSSFGKSLLLYYLGGVDNQFSFTHKTKTFDYSTPINQKKNWAYQAIGTNLRGFIQNVRNGNSFSVANAELRLPIIRYLVNRPINNKFLNNFMIIGFTDVGTAWEGWNPLNTDNAYNHKPIHNGPVTVVIDKETSPILAGVGFGVRSRLLGYYIRADWAWGIDNGYVLPRVFYLSLSTDF